MTTNERKAAAMLIDIVRCTCRSLEMITAIDAAHSADDDLTFAIGQAICGTEDLRDALSKCRTANHEAHKLIRESLKAPLGGAK